MKLDRAVVRGLVIGVALRPGRVADGCHSSSFARRRDPAQRNERGDPGNRVRDTGALSNALPNGRLVANSTHPSAILLIANRSVPG